MADTKGFLTKFLSNFISIAAFIIMRNTSQKEKVSTKYQIRQVLSRPLDAFTLFKASNQESLSVLLKYFIQYSFSFLVYFLARSTIKTGVHNIDVICSF